MVSLRRNKGAEETGTSGWLTTFNDLITLLMVFFVLVFSTSTIDVHRLKNFQSALQSGLGILREGNKTHVAVVDANRPPEDNPDRKALRQEEFLLNPDQVEEMVARLDRQPGVRTEYTRDGLLIILANGILFDSGSAVIQDQSREILTQVAALIQGGRHRVCIEGHTDDLPIATSEFPSNWELSTARSVAVLKKFVQIYGIAPQRFAVVGYGDVRPLYPNNTDQNRARNRRVEILLKTEGRASNVEQSHDFDPGGIGASHRNDGSRVFLYVEQA